MRVLFLVDHVRENGGIRVVHDLARILHNDRTGSAIFVLQPEAEGPLLKLDPAVPVIRATRKARPLRFAIPLGLVTLLRSARKFDVMVAGSEVGYSVWLGWVVARITRRPFVVFVQSSLPEAIQKWMPSRVQFLSRWFNAHADGAVTVSPLLAAGVIENGLAPERVMSSPVGVDVKRLRELARQGTTPADLHSPLLVAIGRFSDEKGFDILIRAHASLRAAGYPQTLALVGEGPDAAELRRLAKTLGVQDSVRFTGFLENPQPLLASADLFILPSRREGMGGLVLTEAMTHGVPIVATDCGPGPRHLLQDGAIGELVPVDDAPALAAAIESFLVDPANLRAKAQRGPERALAFDPARSAALFLEALTTIRERPWR